MYNNKTLDSLFRARFEAEVRAEDGYRWFLSNWSEVEGKHSPERWDCTRCLEEYPNVVPNIKIEKRPPGVQKDIDGFECNEQEGKFHAENACSAIWSTSSKEGVQHARNSYTDG